VALGTQAGPRVALVTGATRGLGHEVARQLGAAGISVVVAGRDPLRVAAVADDLGCRGIELDVADPASVDRAVRQLADDGVDVDVLVNNAGVCLPEGPLGIEVASFAEQMAVNVYGPWLLMRALVPGMVARGYGRVVNVSSGSGSFAEGLDLGSYSVSKAALNALTVTAAAEVPEGVDVLIDALCPGWVRTGMGGPGATVDVEDAAATVVAAVLRPAGSPTATFTRNGTPIPW